MAKKTVAVRIFWAAAVLLFCCGCLKITVEVEVKKNGSGSVIETVYFDKGLFDLSVALGDRRPRALAQVDKVREIIRSQRMGEGVRLISTETVRNSRGDEGIKTVFCFSDINSLIINVEPESLASDLPASLMQLAYSGGIEPMTFAYEKKKGPHLTVFMPGWRHDSTANVTVAAIASQVSAIGSAALLDMLRGFGVWVRIRVDGNIVETNAAWVNDNRDGITVVKLDFTRLADQSDIPEKAMLLKYIGDMEQFYKMCGDMQGMMVQKEDVLSVRFK
jgi:hypothetical protein